jgi:CBS-domain-containing membrane protein
VVALQSTQQVADVRLWLGGKSSASTHQGFPVLNDAEQVLGVLTRRDLLDSDVDPADTLSTLIKRPVIGVREDHSLREAADHMIEADVGRLVVFDRKDSARMIGIITRADLLTAHAQRLRESRHASRHLRRTQKAGRAQTEG